MPYIHRCKFWKYYNIYLQKKGILFSKKGTRLNKFSYLRGDHHLLCAYFPNAVLLVSMASRIKSFCIALVPARPHAERHKRQSCTTHCGFIKFSSPSLYWPARARAKQHDNVHKPTKWWLRSRTHTRNWTHISNRVTYTHTCIRGGQPWMSLIKSSLAAWFLRPFIRGCLIFMRG